MECAASAGQETSEAMAFAECAHKKAILVVTSFVGGNDVFPILPTGFGKSLWNAILPCVFVHILSKYPQLFPLAVSAA